MSLKKLFWEDPYLSACDAVVVSVDETGRITLDKTVAYAFEGGQMSDAGTIGGFEILLAERDGKEIFYTLPQNNLCAGDSVRVEIDWAKRYRIMKLHFAAELVLELVYQNYDHPYKAGANITDEKARLDFVWDSNIADIFPELEDGLDRLVNPGFPVISSFDDVENERRFWQIDGFAKVPCGGTHIRNTSEIGKLRLKRVNPGKGKERIEIYLDI